MDSNTARIWLVYASLIIILSQFLFFILAPPLGYPLTYDQSFRLLEIVLPVFLGYLGAATHFLFAKGQSQKAQALAPSRFLGLLVRGPVVVFAVASVGALVAFCLSNQGSGAPGEGMSVDTLAGILTAILGFLAVTTTAVVTHLFSPGENQ